MVYERSNRCCYRAPSKARPSARRPCCRYCYPCCYPRSCYSVAPAIHALIAMAATFFTRKQATTDAVTLCKNSPQYVAAKELDSFHIDGLVYKRCCKIAKKLNNKPRKKPSIAWSFGEALLRTTDNKPVYYCYVRSISSIRKATRSLKRLIWIKVRWRARSSPL